MIPTIYETFPEEEDVSVKSPDLGPITMGPIANGSQRPKHDQKYQSVFIMTNNSFQAPKSGVLVMQWLRAAVHMYILSFQQLERSLDSVMDHLVDISKISVVKKRSIVEIVQHMFHAWSIIGKCIDTVHWKLAYQPMGDGASQGVMEWFCKRPWVSDHQFVKESLINTLFSDNYPRMKSEPNALSGEMHRFRSNPKVPEDYMEPIEYAHGEYRPHDPDVPYYLSINLLSWVVESLYDTPRSKIYDISLLSTTQKISNMYSTMDPDSIFLTCFSMCQELWDPEKYWLMVMLSQTNEVQKAACQRLNISKVCAKSIYHMYGQGGAPSYDNLKNDGTTFASKTILWTMAAHTLRVATKVRCTLGKPPPKNKYSDYSDLDYSSLKKDQSFDLYVDENVGKLGWRRRIKISSIGHIVMGWASKMLDLFVIDNSEWGCSPLSNQTSILTI